ncbi:hypothetical protein DL96DRAFT_1458619 [Flagelloscypha sp. PMI_526]|nr:hypothetical protein DL96DRAFT_1458619 [Flagelloscypha sp. PMI_526]
MSPKVWLITGTSSGLGRAAAEYVLSKGQIVVATARNPESLSDLKSIYPSTRLLIMKFNVINKDDVKNAFSSAIEHFGRVDVVYSNSGYAVVGELEGVPEKDAQAIFNVNMWGAVNVALEAIRVFREVNKPSGGRLLVASSLQAVTAMGGMGYYSSSKFAIDGFHEALSKELDPSWNIKITLLEIGSFSTSAVGNATFSKRHPAYENTAIAEFCKLMADETFIFRIAKHTSKAAQVFFDIAEDENAPLRVPVGLDAIGTLRERAIEIETSAKYAERWNSVVE